MQNNEHGEKDRSVADDRVSAFEEAVSAAGYRVTHKTLEPLEGASSVHEHDYDVWGLVLSGEFRIFVDGEIRSYGAGEEFKLEAGCTHKESAGPDGAAFVVGLRTI